MIPWFEWQTVSIGPLVIQVWGSFVALGMLLACLIVYKRAKQQGENADLMLEQALWAILGGLFFARVFHILLYEPVFFLQNPFEIFKVWHGGMSSFGGIIGAVLAVLYHHKKRKMDLKKVLKRADIFSFAALYGWMVGRIGCVMIHDHLGRQCDCVLSFAHPDGARLDMALLEIIGLVPLAILFYYKKDAQKPTGWFFALLLIYYGVLRLILDAFRARDIVNADVRYLGLTPGQYSAMVLIVFGVIAYRRVKKSK